MLSQEMKIPSFVALLCAFCIAVNTSRAALVKEGATIDEVSDAMSKAGYEKSGLDMEAREPTHRLEFWAVDEGMLIVSYSTKSNRVFSVSYWLSDERPKATRQTYNINVVSFDTESGRMVVQTKTPKRENKAEMETSRKPSD